MMVDELIAITGVADALYEESAMDAAKAGVEL